ncbi:hypothetical protein DC31_07785 [Microbacterium sp. CH12i]|uniref:hypothetical protein n=1 Tax=Microbacterium sp. CH12i TaxID=1479651 RepID=UPI0004610467|nr:hypothetical protein [Microbacterium sp. CH12i]KDA06930.1 hypothetical protein DC31_07785 [Microbacterium sp. CH12i]
MAKDAQALARSDRNDLGTAVVVAAFAVGFLIYNGIRQIAMLFSTPGAITVETPLTAQPFTANIGAGASATAHAATLMVSDVSAIGVIFLVLGIVLSTVGLIVAAVLGAVLCRRLLRGHVFDATNTRLTFAISLVLLIGPLGNVWFTNMGLNGVFAAAGGEFESHPQLLLDAVPLFVASIAVGVLVIVFRRGAALQRDAEGLV